MGQVRGIKIYMHWTFLILVGWIFLSYLGQGEGFGAALKGVAFILAVFCCVVLHEFGHALTAQRYHIQTRDITLLPIGGVARLERMPDKPWQELVVAIAGPLVNVVIAAVLICLLGQHTEMEHLERLNQPGVALLTKLASVNIGLVLFNLIPAFPMDGGRVLRALLALVLPYSRATQIAARVGQALAFGFGFVGLFTNPMLIFIAFFIFLAAQQEAALAQMKDFSLGAPVSKPMRTHWVRLPPHARLDDEAETLLRTSQDEFPVVDDAGRVLGVLTRDDIIAALKRQKSRTPVRKFMRRDLPVVFAHEPFEEVFP